VIFVAVGTTYFSTLVRAMDELSLSLSEDVVMQIGRSAYVPEHCEHFRFAPSLFPYYERASLVVSHGGLGIVTEVLNCGRPLVAVEDPDQPDRHQREILSEWATRLAHINRTTHRVPASRILRWMRAWKYDLTVEDILNYPSPEEDGC